MVGLLSPKNIYYNYGEIFVLDCLGATGLYTDALSRQRRSVEKKIEELEGKKKLEEYRSNLIDEDLLYKQSSTSKFRIDYSREGMTEEERFPFLFAGNVLE
jgi:hypothetical protein